MMATCNVASAIAEFIVDVERFSLELPHMTTGQRKSAKKMLENYPELRCESYGFGAERQLHLFKKGAASPQKMQDASKAPVQFEKSRDLPPLAVTFKNTFVDDWVAPDSEPVEFRSLQHQSRSDSPPIDFAAIVKLSKQQPHAIPASEASPTPRTKALTFADSPVKVRNTFVHFEGASADQRAVQSMPHGMFKQCMLEETREVATGYDTPTTMGYDSPRASASEGELETVPCPLSEVHAGQHSTLSIGALVMVEGLLKAPAFNGRSAVVQGWDEATERYSILFASSGGCQQAKVKAEHLRVVLLCP